MAGASSQSGWVSFNGKSYAQFQSKEELEETYYVMGVSKTDHVPTDPDDIMSGLAVIAGGTTSIKATNTKTIFPGDELVARAPPLHTDPSEFRPTQHTGKPAGQLLPIVEPINLRDIEQEQDMTYVTMMRQDAAGVGRESFAELYGPPRPVRFTRRKEAALCMRMGTTMTFLRGVESSQAREIVRIMTPERTKKERLRDELVEKLRGIDGAAELIDQFDADIAAVERTDPTAMRPTGMDFLEEIPSLGISERGPQLHASHSYFTKGVHWAKRMAGSANSGDTMRTIAERKGENERALLWLARMHGAAGTDAAGKGTENWTVVDDLQNHVHLSYAMLETQTTFMPDFSASDSSATGRGISRANNMRNAYSQNAYNHVFEREYYTALHRYGVTNKAFAVAASHAPPNRRDQLVDVVVNSRRS